MKKTIPVVFIIVAAALALFFIGKNLFVTEKAAVRAKRHEEYMRRKSTGWQTTYYQKTRRAKKAAMDAAKEAIRAEDRANGVFYLPNADKTTEVAASR